MPTKHTKYFTITGKSNFHDRWYYINRVFIGDFVLLNSVFI